MNPRFLHATSVVFAVSALTACVLSHDDSLGKDGDETCAYDGQGYAAGDTFEAPDGCNACTCQDDGTIACTERTCAPAGCDIDGMRIPPGESYPSPDGCNTCTCQADGTSVCTEIACEPQEPEGCWVDGTLVPPGESYPAADGCNTCTCQEDGTSVCTERACMGIACSDLSEAECLAAPECAVRYVGFCDCDCAPEAGKEAAACSECPASCFENLGCFPVDESPACPRAGDPRVSYVGEEPAQCADVDGIFACDAGETAFDNECGCGCIDAGAV